MSDTEATPETGGASSGGWVPARDRKGRIYFINHETQSTSWVDPRMPLPEGWEERKDKKKGRTYWVNKALGKSTWTDPRIEIAQKAAQEASGNLLSATPPPASTSRTEAGRTQLSFDEVACPLCLDILFKPTTTLCGHNFCRECLLEVITLGQVDCPLCREILPADIDESAPTCLPINSLLQDIVNRSFPDEAARREQEADDFALQTAYE